MSDTYEYAFYLIHPANTDKIQVYDETIRECYIGSTRCPNKRFRCHRSMCNNPDRFGYNLKVYQHIRANGGFDEWQISILETHTITTSEAKIHERWLIELYESALNTCLPSRTFSEYETSHKKQKKAINRSYYLSHREEYKSTRAANRESINAKRAANKDLINAKAREKYAAKKAASI